MKTSELLEQAKSLIDTKEKWCQRTYIRVTDDYSYQYCSIGALQQLEAPDARRKNNSPYSTAVKLLREAIPAKQSPSGIVVYQDKLSYTAAGHRALMRVWDRAITKAKLEE